MLYDLEQYLLDKMDPSWWIYCLIWDTRWPFFSERKKWEICWNPLKSSHSPYHQLINTIDVQIAYFLVDYYIKSLLIGYWNLYPLFSHQGALNSIVSGWQRHLPPSHHSEQIHSLNVTSKPTRGRWDRLLGHSINLSNPKTPQYEDKLIWKWEQVVRRSCELSRKFSEQT